MWDVQAKAVAQHLKEYDIKRVYVSPFYRSVNATSVNVTVGPLTAATTVQL